MVEEEAMSGVKFGNPTHFLIGKLKVEDVKVLLHTLHMCGLGDDNHAALDEPAERHLCHTLTIPGTDVRQRLVDEQIVPTT
mgnify:CR=1 FL=1